MYLTIYGGTLKENYENYFIFNNFNECLNYCKKVYSENIGIVKTIKFEYYCFDDRVINGLIVGDTFNVLINKMHFAFIRLSYKI